MNPVKPASGTARKQIDSIQLRSEPATHEALLTLWSDDIKDNLEQFAHWRPPIMKADATHSSRMQPWCTGQTDGETVFFF